MSFFFIEYIFYIYFSELTKAYSVLSNLNSRMVSVKNKEAGKKMRQLTDEMLDFDMNGTREVTVFC